MTPTEYAANVAARFGKGGVMPSWNDLARGESAARWQRTASSNMARPHEVNVTLMEREKPKHSQAVASHAANAAKGEVARESILDALTKPMTAMDIAYAIRRSPHLIRRHLSILVAAGQVSGESVKRVMVWHRIPHSGDTAPIRAGGPSSPIRAPKALACQSKDLNAEALPVMTAPEACVRVSGATQEAAE